MKKKCPFGKCEKCAWHREFRYTNKISGEHKLFMKCGIEYLIEEIPRITGAIDGLQGGVNEATNRSVETKQIVEDRTRKFVGTLHAIQDMAKGRLK